MDTAIRSYVVKSFPGVELGRQASSVVLQSFGTDPNAKEGRTAFLQIQSFPKSSTATISELISHMISCSLPHVSSSFSLSIQDYASIDEIRVASTSKPAVNRVSLLFGEHSRELIGPETGLMLLQLGYQISLGAGI